MEGQNKLQELLGDELLTNSGTAVKKITFNDFYKSFRASGKFICLYFGAHWAPPSRLFTKTLDERFYKEVNT